MALHSNLQRRKTGYYFRQAIPVPLVPLFGKSEIVRSLKTHDPALAKERCRQMALEVSGWFDSKALPVDNQLPDYARLNDIMPETEATIGSQLTPDITSKKACVSISFMACQNPLPQDNYA